MTLDLGAQMGPNQLKNTWMLTVIWFQKMKTSFENFICLKKIDIVWC